MTLLVVLHDTPLPALDGMIAGAFAAMRGANFVTLASGGAGHARFDGAQHVLADGALAPNGVLWAERACDRLVTAPLDREAVARMPGTVVVPFNPHLPAQHDAQACFLATAEHVGRPLESYEVEEIDGLFMMRAQGQTRHVGAWRRDSFGRPVSADEACAAPPGRSRRILIVGDELQFREVYPAVLAALGDAAEMCELDLSVVFSDPREEPAPMWDNLLTGVDGLLLPGGSDMEQVCGQILAARAAIRRDLPTVGLCLGMQTMATAVAQEICGMKGANLAEVDPDAPIQTFVRLCDAAGRPVHRLGIEPCRLMAGSRLSALAGGAATLDTHYNHRFVLASAIETRLEVAGLVISGRQTGSAYADAIEMPGLRFFVAMQGHPELASRRGRPHPLLTGFLAAVSDNPPGPRPDTFCP